MHPLGIRHYQRPHRKSVPPEKPPKPLRENEHGGRYCISRENTADAIFVVVYYGTHVIIMTVPTLSFAGQLQ